MLAGTPAAINAASAADSANGTQTNQLNQLISYYLQNDKQQGPAWLKTTDISLSFTEDDKPLFSLETIQPFSQTTKNNALLFWQGRYSYQSDTDATANLGIGWRKLSEDKTSLIGFNAFYDYGFQHDLSRVGVGAEYFNNLAEYRANFYFPTSSDRHTGDSNYIRAVQGLDYEIGSALTKAPWLGFYASGFYYNNKYNDDEKGYKLRSTLQVSPRLSLEMGYTNSNLEKGHLYGAIQYQLADKLGPSLFGDSPKNKQPNDISYKLLQKVQRENEIKTESFTKSEQAFGTVVIYVRQILGDPLGNYTVYANINGTIRSATSDAITGNATFYNVPVGTYNFYNEDETITENITVLKDQTAGLTFSIWD
jgi:hypothetical protein